MIAIETVHHERITAIAHTVDLIPALHHLLARKTTEITTIPIEMRDVMAVMAVIEIIVVIAHIHLIVVVNSPLHQEGTSLEIGRRRLPKVRMLRPFRSRQAWWDWSSAVVGSPCDVSSKNRELEFNSSLVQMIPWVPIETARSQAIYARETWPNLRLIAFARRTEVSRV